MTHPLEEAVDQVRRRPFEIRQIADNQGTVVALMMSPAAYEQLTPAASRRLDPKPKSRRSRKERKRRADSRQREADREREVEKQRRSREHVANYNRKHRAWKLPIGGTAFRR
jgi:hypothetical protein